MADAENQKYVTGRLDAITHLATAIAAIAAPQSAQLLLGQIAKMRSEIAGRSTRPYEEGYVSVESSVMSALRMAADAEKIRSLGYKPRH